MSRPDSTLHQFVTFIECFERVYSVRHSCKYKMEFLTIDFWNFLKKSLDLSLENFVTELNCESLFPFHTPNDFSLKQKQFHISEYATFHLFPSPVTSTSTSSLPPMKIFLGESSSPASFPSPLIFFLFIFSTNSLQDLQVCLSISLFI